jgi:hypothetical protein
MTPHSEGGCALKDMDKLILKEKPAIEKIIQEKSHPKYYSFHEDGKNNS